MYRHLIRHGDIEAARKLELTDAQKAEMDRDYAFTASRDSLAENSEATAKWECDNGVSHGLGMLENEENQPLRIKLLMADLRRLPPGSRVLDYACGQGHHTEFIARKMPDLYFIGTDLCRTSIEVGREYMKANPLPNCELLLLDEFSKRMGEGEEQFDIAILGEVLEHVIDPQSLADLVEGYVIPGGTVYASTPYGPWEQGGREFDTNDPLNAFRAQTLFRAHIHHFEHADLREMFGHKPGFNIAVAPYTWSMQAEALGCFHFSWRVDPASANATPINYVRKLAEQAPRDTLSICMIVKSYSASLRKALDSVQNIVSEIVIAVDGGQCGVRLDGNVWQIGKDYGATTFPIRSPLVQGFGQARNDSIARATGDWIMWLDDDESVLWPERIPKYLRQNIYQAYAVKHHHVSGEPAGLLKTDLPCRIFRNRIGAKFYGMVHEHPEIAVNQGFKGVLLLPDTAIIHAGYDTEDTRRKRFERNLPLMQAESDAKPRRNLWKMLWIRDLAHLNRYDAEAGRTVPQVVANRANEGIGLWRELLKDGHARMAVDSMSYYTELTRALVGDGGIKYAISTASFWNGIGEQPGQMPPPISGEFTSPDDIDLLTAALTKDRL